jgi:hypothetical protein
MKRIYYDTEFTSMGVDAQLISAGFASECGQSWYAEITSFEQERCSAFVLETVLPLLDASPEQRFSADDFGSALATWLAGFADEIELVSDHSVDWYQIEGLAGENLRALPNRVHPRVWKRSEDKHIRLELELAESTFWHRRQNRQHHALEDARRLEYIASLQLKFLQPQSQ